MGETEREARGPIKRLLSGQLIRWAGLAITAAAIGLVVWSIYKSDLLASDAWMATDVLTGVAASALIFCASLFCVFAAWYLLIMSVSKVHVSWMDGFYIYAVSAIYRYIPSNVIHYVGRYYMLRQRGVEHAAATWGIVAETALFICASVLIALIFGAPLVHQALLDAAQDNWLLFAVIALVGIVAVAGALVVLRRRVAIRELIAPFMRTKVLHAGVEAFVLHLVARLVSGVALWWLSVQVLGSDQASLPDMIAIWAAAWTLGYVTPGASAGLGVREAVIIAAMVGLGVPMAGATLVAIAFRVATTIGDLIFAAAGWASHRFIGPPAASCHNT
jgi:glycosyltransferase 2 family protein